MTFMIYRKTSKLRKGASVLIVLLAAAVLSWQLPVVLEGLALWLSTKSPRLQVALTSFAALCVQALPFVLIGSIASATVAVFMTPQRWKKVLPTKTVPAIIVAAVMGMVVPTCECSSVPLARRMINSGVPPSAAITFMTAAPSLNPLVVIATLTAFGGWEMAVARFGAGLLAVVGLGLVIATLGQKAFAALTTTDKHDHEREQLHGNEHEHEHGHGHEYDHDHLYKSKGQKWIHAVWHDAIGAATFLVLGGAIAATASAFIPISAAATVSQQVFIAILVMALFAVIASLCSLGDAFVAAALVGVHPAGALAFLVVGPVIDIKLTAMMEGILGSKPTRLIALGGFSTALGATVIVSALLGWL